MSPALRRGRTRSAASIAAGSTSNPSVLARNAGSSMFSASPRNGRHTRGWWLPRITSSGPFSSVASSSATKHVTSWSVCARQQQLQSWCHGKPEPPGSFRFSLSSNRSTRSPRIASAGAVTRGSRASAAKASLRSISGSIRAIATLSRSCAAAPSRWSRSQSTWLPQSCPSSASASPSRSTSATQSLDVGRVDHAADDRVAVTVVLVEIDGHGGRSLHVGCILAMRSS